MPYVEGSERRRSSDTGRQEYSSGWSARARVICIPRDSSYKSKRLIGQLCNPVRSYKAMLWSDRIVQFSSLETPPTRQVPLFDPLPTSVDFMRFA